LYKPEPINTSGVVVDDDLVELSDILAKNSHDRWARQLLAEGWRCGPERDDDLKEHPSLVAYEALPESEKAHYRDGALEMLKALVALGCRLTAPARGVRTQPELAPGTGAPGVGELRQGGGPDELDLATLMAVWRTRDPDLWSRVPDIYDRFAARSLRLGMPLLAYDMLEEGLKVQPTSVSLRQLQALALARGGATERANAILRQLDQESVTDEETLGLLARTHKDLALRAADPAERRRELTRAYDAYARAHRLTGGYWTGINAASLALVLGHREAAVTLARRVRERCLEELGRPSRTVDPYWLLATLGEAALILNEWSEAEDWYRQAADVGSGRLGDLSSTRRNARLIVEYLDADSARIDRCLRIPRVVVFTGHMIDAPGRSRPRFPAQLEGAVQTAIRERIEKLDARVGFAAGACGSDILFLETILEVGGEANVVLPYGRETFAGDSVDIIPGANWYARYQKVLERATHLVTASTEKLEGGGASYQYAGLLLLGLASIRAEQLDTDLVPLTVWDGEAGDGPGGTASTVYDWRRRGYEAEVINLAEILRRECPALAGGAQHEATDVSPGVSEAAPQLMAILFADAVNFSKLTEGEIPRFVQHFLGAIGELLARTPHRPAMKNTWGDGLYFVFSSVTEAGEFALSLSDLVAHTDWRSKGLPSGLGLRIALHAGPVYPCTDPVTGQANYIGSHVSRGARIEPITPPGQIYASEAFAALASAARARGFACEYVGQTLWAKGYGSFATYHVHPRAPRSWPSDRTA